MTYDEFYDKTSKFLNTFRTRSQVRMSAKEKEKFDKEVGFVDAKSDSEEMEIAEYVHEWYDIEMDEMEESDAEEIMPTYNLVMNHIRRDWFPSSMVH